MIRRGDALDDLEVSVAPPLVTDSQSKENSQYVLDPCQTSLAQAAPSLHESIGRDGADGFTNHGRADFEASFWRSHHDVRRDGSDGGGEGQHDDQPRRTAVEAVLRNDRDRAFSRLLVTPRRIEVGEPDLASAHAHDRFFRLERGTPYFGFDSATRPSDKVWSQRAPSAVHASQLRASRRSSA